MPPSFHRSSALPDCAGAPRDGTPPPSPTLRGGRGLLGLLRLVSHRPLAHRGPNSLKSVSPQCRCAREDPGAYGTSRQAARRRVGAIQGVFSQLHPPYKVCLTCAILLPTKRCPSHLEVDHVQRSILISPPNRKPETLRGATSVVVPSWVRFPTPSLFSPRPDTKRSRNAETLFAYWQTVLFCVYIVGKHNLFGI